MNYMAPGWQPWLSKSMLDKLEVAQNKALCIITGPYQSTPLEALRVEAGVELLDGQQKEVLRVIRES